MVPRRKKTWLARLGAVVRPETVGAALLVIAGWAENRRYTDSQDAVRDDSRRAIWRHTLEVERRADSLGLRVTGLERQVRRLRVSSWVPGRAAAAMADTALYGPPMPQGTFIRSIGRLLSSPFGWLRNG